ncbi:glycoside hydrolase [Achlya hypogyna]|uniref:glucan endo-1,3-beta-D-glucosidase n=1 Tax=Achlya hypogyna TaxID=1202772 RepID=A0A0A7CN58_ACHHY|nr:secreted protein [Achlya hypogyna]OQR91788.1 glycoside hydrolase [Achlya hypogyna]
MMRLVALASTCLFGLAAAGADMGVCYDSYDSANMKSHFTTIKERFTAVRTFQTAMGSQNAIDVAAEVGLKMAAGIWLLGDRFETDLKAVIDGAKRHPDTVQVVYVGNEELHNGWNAEQLTAKIHEVKGRLKSAGVNVRVGTVQIDGDYLKYPSIADACDVIGVNIHPFFSGGPASVLTPIVDFKTRWDAMKTKFGDKIRMTESGWPTQGGNFGQHEANFQRAQDYYNAMLQWEASEQSETPYYFMFHDNRAKGGFEAYFGIANPDGKWKWGSPGPSPTNAPTNNPTPSPSNSLAPTPSPSPSSGPAPTPSPSNGPAPTAYPTSTPSVVPTTTPSANPTPAPTVPTPAPTVPTPTPSPSPNYCK